MSDCQCCTISCGTYHGPKLLDGLRAVDARRVGVRRGVYVVDAAVGCDGAFLGGTGGRVVGAEAVDDVVLDERLAGPSVDGEVAVAVGFVGTGVLNDTSAGEIMLRARWMWLLGRWWLAIELMN